MTDPVTGHAVRGSGAAGVRLGDGWQSRVPAAWLERWRPQRFELDGGWTEVVVMGDGPPLVLLPPLPGYKEAWIACAAALAPEFRVITFDLRHRFRGPPSWDALVEDMRRILDVHAPGAAGVAGHSLGGALAQRWALAHPERVSALVLSSTFARVTNPPGNRWGRFVEQPFVLAGQRWLPAALARPIARRLAARGAWVYDTSCDDAVLDLVRHCIRDIGPRGALLTVRLAMAHDTRATLGALVPPTRIVVGELENVFYRDAIAELRRLLPAAEFAVSPGASHLHLLSNANWLADQIAGWMRAPRARASVR